MQVRKDWYRSVAASQTSRPFGRAPVLSRPARKDAESLKGGPRERERERISLAVHLSHPRTLGVDPRVAHSATDW